MRKNVHEHESQMRQLLLSKLRAVKAAFTMVYTILFALKRDHNKYKESMDKKMHQITKRMETAEKDIKAGKSKAATKVLKKAEKKNEKLVKIDREVRDPLIAKCKKTMKKGKK